MKKIALAALSVVMPLSMFATTMTGNGKIATEIRDVSRFSSIEMSGIGHLSVNRGEIFRVEVKLDSNLIDRYRTKVSGGVLSLGFEPGVAVNGVTSLEVEVTLPELERISLSGAAEARLQDAFQGKRFSVGISGSGKLAGALDYRSVEIDISGAGSLFLDGRADDLSIGISGSGDFSGASLATESAKVSISGTGTAKLRARSRLEARISGAGSVKYFGNPTVAKRISGVGRVERLGD